MTITDERVSVLASLRPGQLVEVATTDGQWSIYGEFLGLLNNPAGARIRVRPTGQFDRVERQVPLPAQVRVAA